MAAGSPMSPVAPGQAENQTKQTGARPKQKKVCDISVFIVRFKDHIKTKMNK